MTTEVSRKLRHHTRLDGLFRYAEFLDFGEVHIKLNPAVGLKAIIAIHNLKRGAGFGGCRIAHYASTDNAIEDALRLAYMMSFKSAINNIPHGGAKAVLIAPKIIKDRKAYMQSFGEFVEHLGGRYITAIDSGSETADMDYVAERTAFVSCTTEYEKYGNPSYYTAIGVRRSIEAAVKFKLGKDDLQGTHVAIQGAGHVGYFLAKELHALGARLTMTDINVSLLKRCVDEFNVTTCQPHQIYSVAADVFSPCALGAVLNGESIRQLKVNIVAGSANNQLAHQHHSDKLHDKSILYAPDFVANAGGLIHAAAIYDHNDFDKASVRVNDIYETLMDIFSKAKKENCSTMVVAETMAMERLR